MDNSSIWKIIDAYFRDNPQCLVTHHIESYNDFMKKSIFQIFKEKNPIVLNARYDDKLGEYCSQCYMYMGGKEGNKIYYGKPVIYDENNAHYMFPNEARLRNMTYGMTIHYDIEIEITYILDENEMPRRMPHVGGGGEEEEIVDGEPYPETDKLKTLAEIHAEGGVEGGREAAAKQTGGAKKPPPQITTTESAKIRELTEKSIVGEIRGRKIQKQTLVLEKVYLGKFPIMMQSEFCVLSGFPRETKHSMGECRNDIGGYFIIDGKEKTIIPQEKFADNMLYIRKSSDDKYFYSAEIRSVSENVSKPIRTLSVKIVAPHSIGSLVRRREFYFKNIVVNIPNVRKAVPLFIVFRALGVISDKDIITMCLLDLDKYAGMVDLFIPSVHDAGGILTQRLAIKYIALLTKYKTEAYAMEVLADYFLPHIGELNLIQKAYYLGYIVFRLLNVYTGVERPTDRDNFKFKRIELVGSLLSELFREYYTIQMREIQLGFEKILTFNQQIYESNLAGLVELNHRDILKIRTVEGGFKKAFKGNWGSQTHTKRIGIVQDLNRLSWNSMMSHLRKTVLPLDSSVKLVGPRVLHNTQWGYFDPIDSPDGANIGLHKHLAISTYITQSVSREPMIQWLREKTKMVLLIDCTPNVLSKMTRVIVNGFIAGAVTEPVETVNMVKMYRRNGLIPIYTSIMFDNIQNIVFVYTDGGRLCRPIFYRDPNTDEMSFEKTAAKTILATGEFTWNDLISGFNQKRDAAFHPNHYKMYEIDELYGGKNKIDENKSAILDFIDTSETEGTLIALNSDELARKTRKYTHMEIHESLIFGTMCNQITFPENNPAARNSFFCGQSRQACSLYHTNYHMRMDKTALVLVSGQKPLVKTRYFEHLNREENVYGENTIVAIMCYTGYNVEDAVLINEGALQRGLFHTTYYSTYETHEEKSKTEEMTVNKLFMNIESEPTVVGTKPGYDYSKLDEYGIIRENTEITDKTVLVGVTASSGGVANKVDMSKTPKKGQLGVVDKTFITEGAEGNRIAKVRIREMRVPNLGDKMASRNGQKGTVGLVIPEADMPYTKDGIRPDIIINPHAIPSRMTIGQLVECIVGKAAVMQGAFADCSAFNNRGSKIKLFGEVLTQNRFHSSGNEILYNGMTGEQIETEIFIGPTYYMRLKHMVKDKINYRALGPRTALTRQTVGGRALDGGLRIGEMERDSLISHGISDFLRESMMERGDKYFMAICNTTGMVSIYNPAKDIFMSPMADGPVKFVGDVKEKQCNIENITRFGRDFSVVCVPYSLKLLIQELQTVNIVMRIITEENIDQLENMTFSKNIDLLTFGQTARSVIRETQNILDKQAAVPSVETPWVFTELSNAIFGEEPAVASVAPSPQYPETSPAFVPSRESPREETDSPQYMPVSPEFLPSTPSFSPPPDEPKMHNIGDMVYYRGDNMGGRQWQITNIGDQFLTIQALNVEGLQPADQIRVVMPIDIYETGDYETGGGAGQFYAQQQPQQQHNGFPVGGATQPPVQFNVKIVGGNDQSVTPPHSDGVNFAKTPMIKLGGENSGENQSGGEIIENNSHADGGEVDFQKMMVVKKLE
jgi:DNA-directed RNA polymerase II subunit RPB2